MTAFKPMSTRRLVVVAGITCIAIYAVLAAIGFTGSFAIGSFRLGLRSVRYDVRVVVVDGEPYFGSILSLEGEPNPPYRDRGISATGIYYTRIADGHNRSSTWAVNIGYFLGLMGILTVVFVSRRRRSRTAESTADPETRSQAPIDRPDGKL